MSPESLIRLAELDESVCLVLDLHESFLQLDPMRHVAQALKDAQKTGKAVLKIIHGKGAGVLQEKIRRFLEGERRKERILYFRASDQLGEIGAVLYVTI